MIPRQAASWPDDRLTAVGLAVGTFGPFAIAAVLLPFRDELMGANVALVFVVVVVLAAACGGRVPGAVAAAVSAMSFDFFFTRPYGSLKIERTDDIFTALLLLGIGLLASELMGLAHRSRRASQHSRQEIARLQRVAQLVAEGAEVEDVLLSVRAELLGQLSLRDCHFEEPPFESELPRLERNGTIEAGRRRWVAGEFTLPAEGVEIPVVGRGRRFGRLVLLPDWDVGVSIEERVVAVALVDQLGAALAAEPWPRRTAEGNVV